MISSFFVLTLLVLNLQWCAADILFPGDDGYAEAIVTPNRFCPAHCPSVVVQPRSAVELSNWMRRSSGRVTVKSGGHSYACQSVAADGGQLVDVSHLTEFVFDKERQRARLGAGLTFKQALRQLDEVGYTMPHGECDGVGVSGYLLNGGMHPDLGNYEDYYQKGGYVRRIEGVTAAGSLVEFDDDGIRFVEQSPTEPPTTTLAFQATSLFGRMDPTVTKLYQQWASDPLKVVTQIGGQLIIATAFVIDLVPKEAEPFHIAVVFQLGVAQTAKSILRKALPLVGHDLNGERGLDCSGWGTGDWDEGAPLVFILRCADWRFKDVSRVHRYVRRAGLTADDIYETVTPRHATVPFVARDSSLGLGWTPFTFTEDFDLYRARNGDDLVADAMLGIPDMACRTCEIELSAFKGNGLPSMFFDMMCFDTPGGREPCVQSVKEVRARLRSDLVINKHNLPDCNPDLFWPFRYYGHDSLFWSPFRYGLLSVLVRLWDPLQRFGYWRAVGDLGGIGRCVNEGPRRVGDTCARHGLTEARLAAVERQLRIDQCPNVPNHPFLREQLRQCGVVFGQHQLAVYG